VEYLLGALGGALAVGFQWRLSQRGIAVRNLEISVKSRATNVLVFLGLESDGDPGLERIEGRVYVDADAEPDVLESVLQETLRRCPVTQSMLRQVPMQVELRAV